MVLLLARWVWDPEEQASSRAARPSLPAWSSLLKVIKGWENNGPNSEHQRSLHQRCGWKRDYLVEVRAQDCVMHILTMSHMIQEAQEEKLKSRSPLPTPSPPLPRPGGSKGRAFLCGCFWSPIIGVSHKKQHLPGRHSQGTITMMKGNESQVAHQTSVWHL